MLSMRSVVNHVMNLENAASRLEGLLKILPVPPRYETGLMSSVLENIYSRIKDRSPAQQREMIPLIKFCIKTQGVICHHGIWMKGPNYCDDTMNNIMMALDDDNRTELIYLLYMDEDVELSVIHYDDTYLPPNLPLTQLVGGQTNRLISLKLYCFIDMPRCQFNNLRELALWNVRFYHEPTELTNMACLSSLVLWNVTGIPDRLYRKLTCKQTLPNLEKIHIDNDKVKGLEDAVRHYACSCREQCLFVLWCDFWM